MSERALDSEGVELAWGKGLGGLMLVLLAVTAPLGLGAKAPSKLAQTQGVAPPLKTVRKSVILQPGTPTPTNSRSEPISPRVQELIVP